MKIKIYSTPYCTYCQALKDYLKEKNFEFEEVDVSSDEKERDEMMKKSKSISVPVIEIDNTIISGFNKNEIDKALNLCS